MILCDHFIYASAKTDKKIGYQVIAKSDGITERILDSLSEYIYPLGANLNELKESKSLLVLKNKKIVFSIIKIGIGFDGRSGTVYNHTFVLDEKDFKKLDYDSRKLEKYFIKDESLRGKLKKIEIEDFDYPPDLIKKHFHKTIEPTLKALFKKKKLAIVEIEDTNLIQNLLSILPPKMRLISFSTHVSQPKRQSSFEFIQIPRQIQSQLDNHFVQIDPQIFESNKKKTDLDKSLEYFLDLVNRNKIGLKKFQREFDRIASNDFKNKLIMLSFYHYFIKTKIPSQKAQYANKCFMALNKLGRKGTEKYYQEIANYVTEIKIKKLSKEEAPDILSAIYEIMLWFTKSSFWWVRKYP